MEHPGPEAGGTGNLFSEGAIILTCGGWLDIEEGLAIEGNLTRFTATPDGRVDDVVSPAVAQVV
jgi:hypothetical protein